jgi:hypothetical protein
MHGKEYHFLFKVLWHWKELLYEGGIQMRLSSTRRRTMELQATGCKNSSESQVEQLFLTLNYKQIPLHLLHLQLLGKIQMAKLTWK